MSGCVSAAVSLSAKEFMTRDKSGKLKDTGVRFQDIAGARVCSVPWRVWYVWMYQRGPHALCVYACAFTTTGPCTPP